MNVLVTGGAGYVGSVTARRLVHVGHEVVVLDNLSTGHIWAAPAGRLVIGDLGDETSVARLLKDYRIEIVIHCAGSIEVTESINDPLKYHRNNTANSVALVQACIEAGVKKVVFSSSAAVYGGPWEIPIPETADRNPQTPYGASKLATERMLSDLAHAGQMAYVSLRYFNAAGACPDGQLGEAHDPETHIIPILLQTAIGKRAKFSIFGDDHETPDGTCIRDFVHVEDIAQAHESAMQYLDGGGDSCELNCGYGRGYSVAEVVAEVREVTGKEVKIERSNKRPGDPPILVADNKRIREVLGWSPQFNSLRKIIEHAWIWEQRRLGD